MRDSKAALAGVIAFCLASGVAMALDYVVLAWSLIACAYYCLGCHVTLFLLGVSDAPPDGPDTPDGPDDAPGREGRARTGVADIKWR